MRARPQSRCYGGNDEIRWWLDPEPELIAWEQDYANECDRLATLEAEKTGKRHCGRWYLNNNTLETRISRPNLDCNGYTRGNIYEIALSGCHAERQRKNWLKHMEEKCWMGGQGLADLKRAFDELIKEGTIRTKVVVK